MGFNGLSHIVGSDIIEDLYLTRLFIYLDLDPVSAVGIGNGKVALEVLVKVFVRRIVEVLRNEHPAAQGIMDLPQYLSEGNVLFLVIYGEDNPVLHVQRFHGLRRDFSRQSP